MNDGVLLLRLVLGALMAGHALQKLAGLFSGMGPPHRHQKGPSWLSDSRTNLKVKGKHHDD